MRPPAAERQKDERQSRVEPPRVGWLPFFFMKPIKSTIMKVIEIPEKAPRLSVYANPGDFVIIKRVRYLVVESRDDEMCNDICFGCSAMSNEGCRCAQFDCLSSDKYPNGTHLVRVCPEERGEDTQRNL